MPVAVQPVMDGVGGMNLLRSRRRHGVVTVPEDCSLLSTVAAGLAWGAVIVVVSSSAWLEVEGVLIEGETVVDEGKSTTLAVGGASCLAEVVLSLNLGDD